MKTTLPILAVLAFTLPALALPPLTDKAGDAANGRTVLLDRERGHCLLCHQVRQLATHSEGGFQGNIGTDLSDAGARLGTAYLRARVVDPTTMNPDTVMPAYYRTEALRAVAPPYRNKPILTAQEVEDLVAYLLTLEGMTIE